MLQSPVILFSFAGFLILLMVIFAFAGPSGSKAAKRRINAMRDRHGSSAGAVVEAQMRRIQASRDTRLDQVAQKLLPNRATLKKRLEMTGRDWNPGKYMLVSLGIVAVISVLLLFKGAPFALSLLIGLLFGLLLPHLFVGFLIKKRISDFNKRFPDAIELLVRGLRAGLPISETLGVVGVELPGAIGEEFRNVSDKIKIGRTMDVALQETADRLGTPEFNFFCITLQIQRETGGNLAETLSNLAEVLRKRAQMKLKIKAMSSEAKASAYIIGALPFIVFFLIYSINPTYSGKFFIDPRLMVAGLGGLFWMSCGAFIMRQMINFEI
jgi:tight adherence protein B